LEVAPLLGASANGEIRRAYKESDGFISRIELAATLAAIPGNMEREESRNFLAGEVLPYLRERLPRETGAWLAYSGPRSPRVNPIAMTIGNLFGRFGESSDVPMLDSLGADFMATNANWPEPLKSRIHASLGEAAARAADLIVLRTQR
jgi:hypothetical protein